MNKLGVILLLSIFSYSGYCQLFNLYCELDMDFKFENDCCKTQLIIDTVSNKSNVWQIGAPKKNILNYSMSLPNVIITDTINPYPNSDTSCFYVYHLANEGYTRPHTAGVDGYYFVNSDTLNDFGLIEFSPNNGETWIDLINDTIYDKTGYYFWYTEKPILSGNSYEWKHFSVDIAGFGALFNIKLHDTIIFRYTFITDSISNDLDGLMFDNLFFIDAWEGVRDFTKHYFKLFPNPVFSVLNISLNQIISPNYCLYIYDVNGTIIYSTYHLIQNDMTVDFTKYAPGIYCVELINCDTYEKSVQRFIKVQ